MSSFSSEGGAGGGISVLYENIYIDLFVNYLIMSYFIAFILIGTVISMYYEKYGLLIPSIILVMMYTIMQLGRFTLYHFLFFLIVSYFSINPGNMKINTNIMKVICLNMLIVALLFMIHPIRGEYLSINSIFEVASQQVIDNHTVGFVLFDKEVNNDNSVINQKITLGLRSIGGVTALFEKLYRTIIDSNYATLAFYEGTMKEYDTIIGYNEYGPKRANAFYTCLYSLYMDGREPFIFIIPFMLGIFVKYNYVKWVKYNNLKSIIYVIGIIFILFFSVFQSQFESTTYWIALLYIITFFYTAKHYDRVVN
jgi:oligosaccharide repeat unit polymerase